MARLAGLEKNVIARAREIVTALERGEDLGGVLPAAGATPMQPTLPFAGVGPAQSEVERLLAAADVDGMSPREALAFLADLQARLEN